MCVCVFVIIKVETNNLKVSGRIHEMEGGKNNINTAFIYKILNIYLFFIL